MGLLKGTWTFSRFCALDNLPEQSNNLIDEGLQKNAFSDFIGSLAEKAVGWTDIENMLDTDFAYAKHKCGPYVTFALRVDRKSLPAALVKLKVLEAEKKYMAENGKKRIHRHEHEDIKERISSELLAKALAVPSLYEICWNPSQNVIIFGSHSDKAIEEFQNLFKESFHLILQPFLPWKTEANDSPAHLNKVAALTDAESNISPSSNETLLGREFLTWLWFKSEERNGIIAVSNEEYEVHFLQRLVLAAGDGEYTETVVCQGLHCDMKEGKEALRRGKKIKEARLEVVKDEIKWEFTFKADMFHFQSLKLPAVMELEDEMDREGRNLERIYLIEKVITIMDRLFDAFLQLRNSSRWNETEQPRMEKWVNE